MLIVTNYTLISRVVTDLCERTTRCEISEIYHSRSANATRKNIFDVQFKFTIVVLFRFNTKAERLYLPRRRGRTSAKTTMKMILCLI